jgi:O-antigen biosynthesis protein
LNVVLDNFIGPCFLYRASAARMLGDYDPRLGIDDYDYWMRMNMSFEVAHLGTEELLYCYRVHDDCLSAKAEQLGIYASVHKLMSYQQERTVFFEKPWTIYADEAVREFLKETESAPHRVLPWDGRPVEYDPYEKKMILVRAETLPAVARSNSAPEIIVGAWFERDGSASYLHRHDLRRLRAVCFSREDSALERLALQTGDCFRISSPASLLAQMVCFADNRAFMEATRTAEERARILPGPHFPENRRMRVMLQVENFTQGGLEQVVLDLATSLDRNRFEPSLLVLGDQGPAVEQARKRGIRILTLPKDGREAAYRKLLADERIDLVNAHFSIYGGYLASESGIPFVQTVHTSYVWLPPEEREQYRENDAFTSAYVCVSQSAAEYMDHRFGLSVNKMVVIPNGADLTRLKAENLSDDRETTRARWGLKPEDYVFLNVSSIYAVKSQRELVEAFAKILPSCPNAKLLLLGKPIGEEYHAGLQRAIAESGLEKSVILAGYHTDVGPIYRAADAFVLPSFLEGWSLALTEAVCCGLPAIATDVGGAADLLAEVGGKIIPPPYGSAAGLDRAAFDRHAMASDPQFVENLAKAMESFYGERPRSKLTDETRKKFSSQNAYRNYERIFGWLAQGGYPEAIREWFAPSGPRRNVEVERAV